MRAHPLATALALLLALGLLGCAAQRRLEIRSDPPGATVRLDSEILGTTPYTWEFWDYGTHRLTFYAEGYRTKAVVVPLEPRWYAHFPLDVVSEVLLPVGWTHRYLVSVTLEPGSDGFTQPDLRSVLERARVLREAGPSGPGLLPPLRGVEPAGSQPAAPAAPDSPEAPR